MIYVDTSSSSDIHDYEHITYASKIQHIQIGSVVSVHVNITRQVIEDHEYVDRLVDTH